MFENLTVPEKRWFYRGLLALAKHGGAFLDQGAPKYALGAKGNYDEGMCGSHPSEETLCKMMIELTTALHEENADNSSEIGDWVYTWRDYCELIFAGRIV